MDKKLMRALLVFSVVMTSLPVHAQGAAERPYAWHYGGDWGWGHMVFGSVMMLLFWGVVIVGIVLVVRWLSGGPPHGSTSAPAKNRALEILQERFARGEIDEDEYEKRKRLLSD